MASPQVWVDPDTLTSIRQAQEQIQLEQSKQTETAHQTVKDELPIIVEQYRTSVDVQQRLLETADSIAQLQRGLQDVESLATPLLGLLRARAKHTIAKRTATNQLDALQRLHARVALIQRAEEQLLAGNAQVDAVLDLRRGKHNAVSKIDVQVQARENKVIGAAEAQLRDGFERAVKAFVGDETSLGEMSLHRGTSLRVASLAEKSTTKLTYHTTSVSLQILTSSLDALGILGSLLSTLQAHILRYLVEPLVQSYVESHSLTVQKQEETAGTRLVLVRSADKNLWESLEVIIESLHTFLPSSPSGSSGNTIASFHRHVASDTLLKIRDALLLPLLSRTKGAAEPTAAIDAIVQIVKIIQQATLFEESLAKESEHGPRLIRDLADSRAGNVFVAARKSWVLERVREIVSGKWGHWEGVVVEMERKLSGEGVKLELNGGAETSPLPKSTPMAIPDQAGDDKVEDVKPEDDKPVDTEDREEDGWGLDTPGIPPPAETAVPVETSAKNTEEEDGWGFDDDDISNTKSTETVEETPPAPIVAPKPIRQARKIGKKAKLAVDDDDVSSTRITESISSEAPKVSPPSPPIVVPKPIRQARKIGKKAKSTANTTSEGSGTASPALDSSIERFTSPPISVQEAPRAEEEDASGWEMEWEPEPVEAPPRIEMPVSDVVRERMKVSVALDDVILIVIDELQFVDAFQQADITLKAFTATADQLATVPSETLELVRALVPARYDAQLRDIPALAVQFSNDCAWLAERVRGVMERAKGQGVAVDGLAKQVDKLMSLSTIVLDKQVETQINTTLDTLADLEGLETTSEDQKYQLCTRAFQEVLHKLETLFRIYRDVMTESSCLTTMGQLIDTAISHICTDILALVDITAEESERLKQLCSILRPVEERFTEMNVNIVAFVPHWLRFCYLSEIMEASLVDITYLLDSGALVDFTSDELVHLLLALFTDTPNRAELIGKIMSRP